MGYYNKLSVEIFGDRNRAEVLRFLYRNKPARFSQKQMSMSLNIPPSTMSRTCRKLESLNIVNYFNIGKTILYSLDEESYIVRTFLLPIFESEESFLKKLVENVVSSMRPDLIKYIKEILVFGSISSGTDTPASDIDLAVVIFSDQSAEMRVRGLTYNKAKEIEEHFVHEAALLKIRLDLHIFFDSEKKKRKGISLGQIYEQGTIIWRNQDESSSQKRLCNP